MQRYWLLINCVEDTETFITVPFKIQFPCDFLVQHAQETIFLSKIVIDFCDIMSWLVSVQSNWSLISSMQCMVLSSIRSQMYHFLEVSLLTRTEVMIFKMFLFCDSKSYKNGVHSELLGVFIRTENSIWCLPLDDYCLDSWGIDFLLLASSEREPKRFSQRRIRENPTHFRSETAKSKKVNDDPIDSLFCCFLKEGFTIVSQHFG